MNYLNPFPIGDTELEGIPVLLPTDYQPLLGHDIARRFCWGTPRCALFVLDENNRLLMSRLIVFNDREAIHAVTVKDGKLAVKTESDVTSIEQEKRNDVFFSHAHEDNEWVLEIAQWLRSIWPSLRIFHTNPEDLERFNKDPLYFHNEMRLSRCTVFLTTPRSLKKPWVGAEQGSCVGLYVYRLFTGGRRIAK